jgi:hypothetical protein
VRGRAATGRENDRDAWRGTGVAGDAAMNVFVSDVDAPKREAFQPEEERT